jgi:uncharacterized protein YqeY
MILNDKELTQLIEKHEKKSEEAYRNYQDTGNGRYWSTHKKEEDLADTLKVALKHKEEHRKLVSISSALKNWAGTIAQMPYMTAERKEAEIKSILNEIMENAKWL